MANKIYGSIGGLSNEVVKIYGSIDGLSDNVIKGYCSVGGLSKLFFGNSQPQPIGTVIFENGEFTNLTSPSCQRKTITYAGDENISSAQSNGVIINKDIGWLREYSQTASYPWTITNTQIVSGNIYNISGIQDTHENILAIPVIGDILEAGQSATDIGGKIKITLTATHSTGSFVIGTNVASFDNSTQFYYFPLSTIQTYGFVNNPTSTQYPLNQKVTIELNLDNARIEYLKTHLKDGYWYLCIGSPPSYGYTPKVYIDKIEYVTVKNYYEEYGENCIQSYIKGCWEMPVYVHKGSFTLKRRYTNSTGEHVETINVNLPSDAVVVNRTLSAPSYIVFQLSVYFLTQPSVTPKSVCSWFDKDTYTTGKNNIIYYMWMLQPTQYTWETDIKSNKKTAIGEADSLYANWELGYIAFDGVHS